MLWANKKFTQSVTFSEDAADITLLEAIEKELSVARYQTFSNLCKQALWQFLSVTESAPTAPTANLSPTSNSLQQQLAQLQTQLEELENKILTEEQNQFTRVEARLNRLAQQIAQIQANLDLQALQAEASFPLPETLKLKPPQQPIQPIQPQEKSTEESADPLLNRLSSLLDDF
jgi:nucleotidyltransferase/DNA polymerase involved in DNA repair